ncbi:MAG: T9SS type A sorting domain-containing protein [Bacteroidota bacterium]
MKNILLLIILTLYAFLFLPIKTWAQWKKTSLSTSSQISAIFAQDNVLYAAIGYEGVFVSTDAGNTWISINGNLTDTNVYDFKRNEKYLFVTTNSGVFRSGDSGKTWSLVNSGLPFYPYATGLAIKGTTLYVGISGAGIFQSKNNGNIWSPIDGHEMSYYRFDVSGDTLYAVGNQGLARLIGTSTDLEWIKYSSVPDFAVNGKILIYSWRDPNGRPSQLKGMYVSKDGGKSYQHINELVFSQIIAVDANFIAQISDSVFISSDIGNSWVNINNGLSKNYIRSFASDGIYIFAGIDGKGLWRRPLSEMITRVNNHNDGVQNFVLNQNYPNPFNPITTISVTLSFRSFISLKVFDFLGRENIILANGEFSSGNHSFQWNAQNMSSGVYFYRLQSGLFVETKKLVLLK